MKQARISLMAFAMAGTLISCTGAGPKQATSSTIDMEVKKYVLDNGLIVLIAPNPKLPIVSYYTLFDVGGRDEKKGTTGATHFLEHMMFKGAKKYGPGQFDSILERNGGSTNAFTTNDMTVYYQTLPTSFLDTMIDMEADRMQNMLLEKASFESERQVIFEERKMRYENSPDGLLYLEMMKKVFEGTPYGQSVIGDVQDLKDLTREQMMDFFKKYYVPNNAIVSIAGDVNPDEVIEKIKLHYGSIPFSKELKGLKDAVSGDQVFKSTATFNKEYKIYATNPNPKFLMAFAGDKIGEKRAYALDLLSMIIGDGGSSYMNKKYVRSDKAILTDGYLSNYNLVNSGVVYFGGELKPGVKVEEVKAQLENDFNEMCTNAITPKSLQKAKNQVLASSYRSLKSNSGVALMLARNEKWFNDYKFSFNDTQKYNAVSVKEVKEACAQVLDKNKSIFLSTWDQYPKTTETK